MKTYLLLSLLVSGAVLSGCVGEITPTATDQTDQRPGIEAKQGDTTKSGTLVKQGSKYYLKSAAGVLDEVETYAVDFEAYVDKAVTVTGQYSGDTLFVGMIQ